MLLVPGRKFAPLLVKGANVRPGTSMLAALPQLFAGESFCTIQPRAAVPARK
jgi:hypothetical protein